MWERIALGLLTLALLLPSSTAYAIDQLGGVELDQLPAESAQSVPVVTMPAGLVMTEDGRELWARDPETRRAMASTTKIMTAIVVLENVQLDAEVTVPNVALTVGESAAGLRAGDVLAVRQLLEAMLVKSGNDAAIALAVHVSGNRAAFVDLMNEKAASLGLADTHFMNPHGLDEQGHHTTARDLAVIARYAMNIDDFRRMVAMPSVTVISPRGERVLEASNLLIGEYPGANGVKTGWTNDAGYCLVASAEREGIELIAVVLGSKDENVRFIQAERMLDWGFDHYGTLQLASAEETVGLVPVADYLDVTVQAVVGETVGSEVFDLDGPVERSVSLDQEVLAPVQEGDRVGTLTFTQGERLLAQVPLVAGSSVARPGLWERMGIALTRAWRSAFGGTLMAEPQLLGG
jgi:D-alanyl-D-alanine carboxypeptidase (penicillin-binding protein 5/6)